MIVHPADRELSSHADGAAGADRDAVAAHLAGCPRCARRTAELRVVRRLLAAAPPPRPARPLMPRIAAAPAWLRPVRSLAAVGTGAFLFLFLATAVLQSGSNLGGGSTAAERAAARGRLSAPAVGAPAATAATKASPNAALAYGPTATPAAAASTAPAGESAPPPVGLARAAADQLTARRDAGPPALIFAVIAALCAAVAVGVHRRLRRS